MTAHIEGSKWQWLAMYELESEDVLQKPEYKQAKEDNGDDESKMFDFLSRRVYKLLSSDKRRDNYEEYAATAAGNTRYIGMNSLEPSGLSEQEFHGRLESEHIPLMSKVPGWLRSSRWELIDARDPRQ